MSDERFKKIIGVLIATVTLLATIMAFLESDAGARDDEANRDAQTYAMAALGQKVSGDSRANYDVFSAYQTWYELDLLANSSELREDEEAAERYRTVRDQIVKVSPFFTPDYFDPETGQINVARYEADTYLVNVTRLTENFAAASVVKDAWDTKANTYIVHLTMMAIALFLLGLATTVSAKAARTIFVVMGMVIALFATGWAASVYAEPVFDLRTVPNAIDKYAEGIGFAHQGLYEEAIAVLNEVVTIAPDYINALTARGSVYMAMEDYAKSAADYEAARALGDQSAWVAGDLAYAYLYLGQFEDAINVSRVILESYPNELWIRFDLGQSLLAAGEIEAARQEYQTGMNTATELVATARAAGNQPPSDLWWSLDAAALELDYMVQIIDGDYESVIKDKIAQPDVVRAEATQLLTQLKSLAVALEFTSQPPQGELTAVFSPLQFGEPVYDEESGEVSDYFMSDTFENGANEVSVFFDYEGMQDGQMVIMKLYFDDEEDPSWRSIFEWEDGESGNYEYSLSLSYSDVFILDPGEYTIEFYVDNHLAGRGKFTVEEA